MNFIEFINSKTDQELEGYIKYNLAKMNLSNNDKNKILNSLSGNVIGASIGGGISISAISSLGISGLSAAGITSGLSTLGFGLGMIPGLGVAFGIVALGSYIGSKLMNNEKIENVKDEIEKEHYKLLKLYNENKIDKNHKERIEKYLNYYTLLKNQIN